MMPKKFNPAVRTIKNILFVPKCVACDELLVVYDGTFSHQSYYDALCRECYSMWKDEIRKICKSCGRQTRRCLCVPSPLDGYSLPKLVIYKTEMGGIVNDLIYAMKNVNNSRLFACMAYELASSLHDYLEEIFVADEDCLFTWIPRGRKAMMKHGFDQSERLAHMVADRFPIREGDRRNVMRLLKRCGSTSQKRLAGDNRAKNAEQSLTTVHRAKEKINGRLVIMVDDVVTTGETMNYALSLIKTIPDVKVLPICVGRTVCQMSKK